MTVLAFALRERRRLRGELRAVRANLERLQMNLFPEDPALGELNVLEEQLKADLALVLRVIENERRLAARRAA